MITTINARGRRRLAQAIAAALLGSSASLAGATTPYTSTNRDVLTANTGA